MPEKRAKIKGLAWRLTNPENYAKLLRRKTATTTKDASMPTQTDALEPYISYDATRFQFPIEDQTRLLTKWFGLNALTEPPHACTIVKNPEAWDGHVCLPTRSYDDEWVRDYRAQFEWTVNCCRILLRGQHVRLESYVDPKLLRLRTRTAEFYCDRRQVSGLFQLGRHYAGQAPQTVASSMLRPEECALDPASVLLILTLAVMERGPGVLQ